MRRMKQDLVNGRSQTKMKTRPMDSWAPCLPLAFLIDLGLYFELEPIGSPRAVEIGVNLEHGVDMTLGDLEVIQRRELGALSS